MFEKYVKVEFRSMSSARWLSPRFLALVTLNEQIDAKSGDFGKENTIFCPILEKI